MFRQPLVGPQVPRWSHRKAEAEEEDQKDYEEIMQEGWHLFLASGKLYIFWPGDEKIQISPTKKISSKKLAQHIFFGARSLNGFGYPDLDLRLAHFFILMAYFGHHSWKECPEDSSKKRQSDSRSIAQKTAQKVVTFGRNAASLIILPLPHFSIWSFPKIGVPPQLIHLVGNVNSGLINP